MFNKIDENQKSRVLEFDKQKDSYEALMYKIVIIIFSICLVLCSMLKSKESLYSFIFSFFAVNSMVMQFAYTKDRKSNRGTSVFEIIKHAPIDRDVYVAVRMQYIIKYFTKVLVATLSLKVIIMLIDPATYSILDFIVTVVEAFVVPIALGYIELKQTLK